MRNWIAVGAVASLLAACSGKSGGDSGPTGLPLEPAGVVGYVKDTAGAPVVGATVYLVPAGDIPTADLPPTKSLSPIDPVRSSTVDEPLEDTIALNGSGYQSAVTDESGVYRIKTVAAGSYFMTVIQATTDDGHLPGGSNCRTALASTALVNKQLDVKVSTKPSASAEYIGPSACVGCHAATHEKDTLHANGIKPIGAAAPTRFPDWFKARDEKFTEAGTTLYFVWDTTKSDVKIYETTDKSADPNLIHTAKLYKSGSEYFVEMKKANGTAWPGDGVSGDLSSGPNGIYKVELSYGGGLYKQRYLTKIGNSRYVLPIQCNSDAASGVAGTSESDTVPYNRWVWQHYNLGHWGTASTADGGTPATPSAARTFDHMCAGCHFTGFKLDTANVKASAVGDPNGDYDYDGDGKLDVMNITCETCHGPGSEHRASGGKGRSIVTPGLLTPEREVTICAQCHTRFKGMPVTGSGPTLTGSEAALRISGTDIAVTFRAGERRSDFLTNNVSDVDDGLWDATNGDGKHSAKHHQQASDFLRTKKYRNPFELVTCSSCHDLHGDSGLPHQLTSSLDSAGGSEGLCLGCHKRYLPGADVAAYGSESAWASATVGQRMQKHWASKGVANMGMGDIECGSCHMPKTAKSGSGLLQKNIAGTQYWSGDIASHLFQVPLRANITWTKSASMMPIPYTNACGSCHTSAP